MASGLFTLKQVNQAVQQGAWSGYAAPKWVEYLVVAGGGGGGTENSGGGGAGGLLTGIVTVAANTSYTVTVGAGGAGTANSSATGAVGSNSAFNAITTLGGGGGGSRFSTTSMSGGSGGGAGQNNGGNSSSARFGGAGTPNQGNSGGTYLSDSPRWAGAGGGGAGTAGTNSSTSFAGNGGAGIASAISGVTTIYAGGGGGGTRDNLIAGYGGVGGGGAGASSSSALGANGVASYGGGGGGGGQGPSGGSGGSGIVIVRYPGNVQFYTGGAVTYAAGHVVHTFYASGILAPTTPATVLTDYQIQRSLRFNSADSAYLNRTPATAGNRRTWTISFWIKKTANGASYTNIFGAADSASNRTDILWHPSDYLRYYDYPNAYSWFAGNSAGGTWNLYRDVSAWYHIVIAVDTTQASNADRVKGYINGSFVANGSTDTYTQNAQTAVNSTISHILGGHAIYGQYMNAYLTEVNFIDGQQLTASSFGQINANTGVWQPKAYSGTYGTNGFYLNFSDNSNATNVTLGKDYSGNSNNWTPNNFSVTAGAGNDSLVDSPTSYGVDNGAGGEVRGNYATINPFQLIANVSVSNGNLYLQSNNNADQFASAPSTIAVRTGKWYAEFTASAVAGTPGYVFGVARAEWSPIILDGSGYYGRFYVTSGGVPSGYGYHSNSNFYTNGGSVGTGATYASGDIIGIALNLDAGSIAFYKNGVLQGTPFTSIPLGVNYVFAGGAFTFPNPTPTNIAAFFANFGQRPFAYTAPSGFKALCTQNLPAPAIGSSPTTLAGKYFNTVTFTSPNGGAVVTGVGFQPDFSWTKGRSAAEGNILSDVIRGNNAYLLTNSTAAEGTLTNVWAPSSDGYSIVPGTLSSGQTYVGWNWKAGGPAITNTAGTITSQVSANPTAGFSIVTYTGNSTAGATRGHGLNAVPKLILIKGRAGTYGVDNWHVYHASLPNTQGLSLNSNAAAVTSEYFWNNTSPSSTTFTTSTGASNNHNGTTYVAYCFAEIEGYSKFGSYIGNGSTDGPFIYTGFRPAYVLIKSSSHASNWLLLDNKRNTYNVEDKYLAAETSAAEGTLTLLDFTSNGFKIRSSDTAVNGGDPRTYVYACFAENPFKYSLAR